MAISYEKLRTRGQAFVRLTGLTATEFDTVVKRVRAAWEAEESKKAVSGRPHALAGLENHLLALLVYYRSYTTQEFIGYIFGCDAAAICRGIKRLESLLAGVMAIKKDRTLKKEEVEALLIDVTEQPIERPTRKQRKHYSGKKKRHTVKTEIGVKPAKEPGKLPRIRWMDTGHKGKQHDYDIRKKSRNPIPKDTRAYVDSGYQGLDKVHTATELPYKKPKGGTLDKEQRQYNTALSRVRVPVENTIRRLKIFRILKETYRNKRKAYGQKINIIAGLVNLKAGYA
jgi:IS5 family transposase